MMKPAKLGRHAWTRRWLLPITTSCSSQAHASATRLWRSNSNHRPVVTRCNAARCMVASVRYSVSGRAETTTKQLRNSFHLVPRCTLQGTLPHWADFRPTFDGLLEGLR